MAERKHPPLEMPNKGMLDLFTEACRHVDADTSSATALIHAYRARSAAAMGDYAGAYQMMMAAVFRGDESFPRGKKALLLLLGIIYLGLDADKQAQECLQWFYRSEEG